MSNVIFEFYGAPGVGKTYLAKKLAQRFESNGLSVNDSIIILGEKDRLIRFSYKLLLVFLCCIRFPSVAWSIIIFCWQAGITTKRGFIKVVFNWLHVFAAIKKEINTGNLLLLDQGFIQAIWSTRFRVKEGAIFTEKDLLKMLVQKCKIDKWFIVRVSVDKNLHKMRLHSRENGNSPLDNKSEKSFEKGMNMISLVDSILADFSACNIVFINYENSGEVMFDVFDSTLKEEAGD